MDMNTIKTAAHSQFLGHPTLVLKVDGEWRVWVGDSLMSACGANGSMYAVSDFEGEVCFEKV
jgi:hypothetical protein